VGLPSVPGEDGLGAEFPLETDKMSPSGEFGFDGRQVVVVAVPS